MSSRLIESAEASSLSFSFLFGNVNIDLLRHPHLLFISEKIVIKYLQEELNIKLGVYGLRLPEFRDMVERASLDDAGSQYVRFSKWRRRKSQKLISDFGWYWAYPYFSCLINSRTDPKLLNRLTEAIRNNNNGDTVNIDYFAGIEQISQFIEELDFCLIPLGSDHSYSIFISKSIGFVEDISSVLSRNDEASFSYEFSGGVVKCKYVIQPIQCTC